MFQRIAIINYGTGNLHSISTRLMQLDAEPFIVQNAKEIELADKIILPGVGHFGKSMEVLKTHLIIDALHEAVIAQKKPVLGICLGMQLMAQLSEEAPGVDGLGWIHGQVARLQASGPQYKIPHIGWNQLLPKKENRLFSEMPDDAEFYFSHSFRLTGADRETVIGETEYGDRFVSAIARDNIFGVQFHPEKSFEQGLQIFKNFLSI